MNRSDILSADELRGQLVVDADGQQIGTILGVYLDNDTRQPEWVAVRLPSTAITPVPVSEASPTAEGLRVPFARDRVLRAPYRQAQLASAITEEQEATLYRYYASGDGGGSPRHSPSTRAPGRRPSADSERREVAGAAVAGARHVGETAVAGGQQVPASAARQAGAVAEAARAQAGAVIETAREQAAAVAKTARKQAAGVAEEASAQTQELLDTTSEQVVGQAKAQLDQLVVAMHRLAGQALALARGNPEMAGQVAEVVGRAGAELQSASTRIEARGSQGLLTDAQRVVREHPTAASVLSALALVGAGKLLASPVGDKVKATIAPLKDQAIEAGRSVAEGLKPVVQQRVEGVKVVATQAADQLKQETQSSARQVKGAATASAATVKGTARRSAALVKATAAQSASTVKRTTRAAAAGARPDLAQ